MEALLLWPLLMLIRSDFRERQVGVLTLLVFGGIQWGICLADLGTAVFTERLLENFLLLAVWGIGVGIWFRWCRPGRKNARAGFIGKGDVAFLVCFLPVFSLRAFLIFLLTSFGTSLICWAIWHRASGATIPLVSMLGICYLPVLLFRMYGY